MNELVSRRLGELEFERLALIANLQEKEAEIASLKAEIEKLKSTSKVDQ